MIKKKLIKILSLIFLLIIFSNFSNFKHIFNFANFKKIYPNNKLKIALLGGGILSTLIFENKNNSFAYEFPTNFAAGSAGMLSTIYLYKLKDYIIIPKKLTFNGDVNGIFNLNPLEIFQLGFKAIKEHSSFVAKRSLFASSLYLGSTYIYKKTIDNKDCIIQIIKTTNFNQFFKNIK
jgi:hypothetical protein